MVEGARLECVYAVIPYRGFESHPLRQNLSCGFYSVILTRAWIRTFPKFPGLRPFRPAGRFSLEDPLIPKVLDNDP